MQESNAARTTARDAHILDFIGVDGEGVTRDDGTHDYVLLSVGDRSLHNDGTRLDFESIMSFLWECFLDSPRAVFVGYFLGYDFTHWLRSLPENRARILLSKSGIASRARNASGKNTVPFPVEYGDWEFDILGTKRFKLRKVGASQWMYVNDAGSFFQSSFLTAINPAKWPEPILTEAEYATIVEGKQARATAIFDTDMVRYNITENAVLSRLMDRLNRGFVAAGVRLPRQKWFGPGQAAQAWMGNIGAPTGQQIREAVPIAALEAAQQTYYGGWFEIFAHGLIPGESYEYDINSAYPYIISQLPCLLHGEWTFGDNATLPENRDYLMVKARVRSPRRRGIRPNIGTMLHRLPTGVICRPMETEGWFWWHELEAAKRAGLVGIIRVYEWSAYSACECPPPYASIADLYQRRLAVGKNTPEGKALKLLYNSAYGKMAQSIGSPIFSCSIYASLITAGCRTMILDAIATHPGGMNETLMVATDGVYFRSPHLSLDLDKQRLGAWDASTKTNLSLFMPGVYWDDCSRDRIRRGEAPELKSRGISARDLAAMIEDIDLAWAEWKYGNPPTMRIPVTFNMVSAVQALARGKWDTAGKVTGDRRSQSCQKHCPITSLIRAVSSNPHNKRDGMWWDETRGYIVSQPYTKPWLGEVESTPYAQTFGMEEIDFNQDFAWETPDGSINMAMSEALNG